MFCHLPLQSKLHVVRDHGGLVHHHVPSIVRAGNMYLQVFAERISRWMDVHINFLPTSCLLTYLPSGQFVSVVSAVSSGHSSALKYPSLSWIPKQIKIYLLHSCLDSTALNLILHH